MSGSMCQMIGQGGGDSISLNNQNLLSSVIDPIDATAVYRLTNGGEIEGTNSGGNLVTDIGDWIAPKTNMALYSARVTMLSGSLSSGTTGSFLNLGTTRTWTRAQTIVGTSTCQFTIEIQRDSDSAIVASATIDLTAEVN